MIVRVTAVGHGVGVVGVELAENADVVVPVDGPIALEPLKPFTDQYSITDCTPAGAVTAARITLSIGWVG